MNDKNKDKEIQKLKEKEAKAKTKLWNLEEKLKEKESSDLGNKWSGKKIITMSIITFIAIVVLYQIGSKFFTKSIVKIEEGLAVKTKIVSTGSISNDAIYSARLSAEKSVPIVLTASGEVNKVFVKLGDEVKKDQVLFTIDAAALRANYEALNAQYDSARIQAEVTKNSLQMELDNMKKTYDASKEIYELGGMSKSDFDKLESSYKTLQMNYDNAVHSYNLIVNGVNDGSYSASASKDSIKAQLDNARTMLSDATVKSPIDGIVSELNVKEKNMLSAGLNPCTIVNMDSIEINLSVSEHVITQIHKGDKVKIILSSVADEEFEGEITALSPAASSTTGSYPVVIKVTSKDERIKHGMFAKVLFFTELKENVVVVPKSTVITLGDETYVFVKDKNNCAKKVIVETGVDNGNNVEIISGINKGDVLITSGQEYLVDGQKVREIKENKEDKNDNKQISKDNKENEEMENE